MTVDNKEGTHDKIHSTLGDQHDSVISGGTDPAGHRPEKRPHLDPWLALIFGLVNALFAH